jgi:hypothetical protein
MAHQCSLGKLRKAVAGSGNDTTSSSLGTIHPDSINCKMSNYRIKDARLVNTTCSDPDGNNDEDCRARYKMGQTHENSTGGAWINLQNANLTDQWWDGCCEFSWWSYFYDLTISWTYEWHDMHTGCISQICTAYNFDELFVSHLGNTKHDWEADSNGVTVRRIMQMGGNMNPTQICYLSWTFKGASGFFDTVTGLTLDQLYSVPFNYVSA